MAVPWAVLNSKAYRELPGTAAKMLPLFLGKPKVPLSDKQYHRFEFTFTYREGIAYGCARKTFSNVVKALVRFGFVDPVKKGGRRSFGLGPSVFKLSQRWERYGACNFERVDWECFGAHQIDAKFKNDTV